MIGLLVSLLDMLKLVILEIHSKEHASFIFATIFRKLTREEFISVLTMED